MADIIGYTYEMEITEQILGSDLQEMLNNEQVTEYHLIDDPDELYYSEEDENEDEDDTNS